MDNKSKYTGILGVWVKIKEWWVGFEEPQISISKRFIHTIFMAFTGKARRIRVVLPENFNLNQLKIDYPPENYGFGIPHIFRDFKIYYILHLLSSIPGRNSDIITADGFVPINAAILQSHIKDYRLYLNYLLKTDVLICDTHYIPEKKSLGYKWGPQYEGSVYQNIETLVGDYEEQKDNTVDRALYPYLFYWYGRKKLQIYSQAYSYAESIRRIKMQDTTRASWDWNRDKGQYKNPFTQYTAVLRNIDRITSLDYEPHIDGNVHRLHSVLTNIQKDFRNFITYDEQQLVGIDIKNCQPYLTCLLLNPEFWQRDSSLPLTLYNLPNNIQSLFQSDLLFTQITEFFRSLSSGDIAEYKQLVSSGLIYEQIMDTANSRILLGQSPIERKEAKVLMFYLLFSSNRGQHNDPMINNLRRIFTTELYPKVAKLFRIIKQNYSDCEMEAPHSRLSRLLQAIESTIILHRCCNRIWAEGQHLIPIFTIHDSIATTQEHLAYVQTVMQEEFTRHIGMPPALSNEAWNIENLNQDLLHS